MISKLHILAEAAAEYYDISIKDLKSKSRKYTYSWPRMVCQSIAATKYSQPVVAKFWNLDRSSVSYSSKTVKNRMETEPDIRKEVNNFMVFLDVKIKEAKK